MLKDMRRKNKINTCGHKRQSGEIDFVIHTFHVQVGGFVPTEMLTKKFLKKCLWRKMQHRHGGTRKSLKK